MLCRDSFDSQNVHVVLLLLLMMIRRRRRRCYRCCCWCKCDGVESENTMKERLILKNMNRNWKWRIYEQQTLMYHSSFTRIQFLYFLQRIKSERRSVSVELNNINGIINYSVLNQKSLRKDEKCAKWEKQRGNDRSTPKSFCTYVCVIIMYGKLLYTQ